MLLKQEGAILNLKIVNRQQISWKCWGCRCAGPRQLFQGDRRLRSLKSVKGVERSTAGSLRQNR